MEFPAGPAVVVVASGGIPVVKNQNAAPATVVTHHGIAITLVATLGIPMALFDTDGEEYTP